MTFNLVFVTSSKSRKKQINKQTNTFHSFGMIMLCLTLMASIKSMSCYCLASLTLNYLSHHSIIFSETHNLQSHTKLKVSNLSKVGWTPLKIIISRYISLRLKINSRVLHIQSYVFFFLTFPPSSYILN